MHALLGVLDQGIGRLESCYGMVKLNTGCLKNLYSKYVNGANLANFRSPWHEFH